MAGAAKRFNIAKFFKETRAEVKKVTWPSRKELFQHTEVVITSIILVGAVIWIMDFAFARVLNLLLAR
ncbi:MAG: preprotein translocase subunit SecE [Lutisporaceae bacterium]|jgi:preprotein translocase subunit SecE